MDAKDHDVLRRHWSSLRKDLEPIRLLPFLVDVLDTEDEQEVKAGATRRDMVDTLLDILPRKGPEAFGNFLNALKKIQPHLAAPLIQESENEEMKTRDQKEDQEKKETLSTLSITQTSPLQQVCPQRLEPSSSQEKYFTIAKYSKQWKKVPTILQLLPIIEDLGDRWQDLGTALNLKKAEIRNIDGDFRYSRDKARFVLLTWIKQKGRDATIGRLAAAINKIGEKSTAQTLLEQLETEEEGEEGYGLQQESNDELREETSSQILRIPEGQVLDKEQTSTVGSKRQRPNQDMQSVVPAKGAGTVSSVEDVQDVISSSVVTKDGGSVSVKGVKLTCPTGAVDDPVTIKLKLEEPYTYCGMIVHHGLENDVIFGAPIINCQPNGQMFKKHVRLTVALYNEIGRSPGALLVLHGAPTINGKIVWEDITHNSRFDSEKEELQVEMNQFSFIAVLLRLTWVQAKEIITRLNLVSFKYTLSVLFKSNHQRSLYDELALVFMSQDIYQEQLFREHEDSALMQLQRDGFEELGSNIGQERGYIYNKESLTVSIQLGEDYKPVNSQQERIEFMVESSVWWSTGHVIRVRLQGSSADAKSPKILFGRVAVQGQHGHVLDDHFYQSDLCAYVRRILGVERVVFNLKPVVQKLGLLEEIELNQVVRYHWQSEVEQLKRVLQSWQGNTEGHVVLRKALEGLEPEEYKVKERGQLHIRNLRELALTYDGLQHNDPETMKYLSREIKTLCNSVLRDCCIEMEKGFNLATEKYATFLVMNGRISEDVATNFEEMYSSPEDSIKITNTFFMIVPQLIQAIKEIFRDERIPQVQSGLRGVADKATLDKIASDIKYAVEVKNIFKLLREVCKILENLCLNNNDNRTTEDEILYWGRSLSIAIMMPFLQNFFQCFEAQRLYKRLRVFSLSIGEIHSNPSDFEGSFLRDFHHVALSLLQFAKFDASQLVRFELIDPTNSSNTAQANELKHDKSNETFSQQFWIRKECEDELQLEAIAHVHINGHIRSIGALNVRCTEAGTLVGLRLSHKWGSETIDLEFEDFVTLANPTARGAFVSDLEIAAEMDQLAIANECPVALPITSDSTAGNYSSSSSFVMDPSDGKLMKEGTPSDDDLEELSKSISTSWMDLGRRLIRSQATLDEINERWPGFAEKAYRMLLCWKRENGSNATFRVLNEALCHEFVNRRDLAEDICFDHDSRTPCCLP